MWPSGPGLHAQAHSPRVLLVMGEVFANGGIQRFNRTFLAACELLGVHCTVLSLNDTSGASPASMRFSGFGRRKGWFAASSARALLFDSHDVVVAGHINLLTLVARIGSLRIGRKPRLMLIAHGIEVWSSVHGARRRAMRQVDNILCVSNYTAEMIRSQAPEVPASRFNIFPNALSETWAAVAMESFTPLPTGVPEHYILSVTRLDRNERYKGLISALEAFAMLRDRSLHYVIAGRGNDQAFLESVASRLGVRDRVHFLGAVSDGELARLYRACGAFVLPSGKEGFGIVFLEAMFFGAPVIAAQAKGAVDVVQHERTGLLVNYGDCVGLAEALERVLSDRRLRDRIRRAGRRTVIGDGRFTFSAYVRRLGTILGIEASSEIARKLIKQRSKTDELSPAGIG